MPQADSSEKRLEEVRTGRRRSTSRYLAAYSVAAAGGMIVTDEAAAAIVPIQLPGGGPVVVETPDPGNQIDSYALDIDGDGVNDFRLLSYLGTNINGLSRPSDLNGVVLDYMVLDVRFLSAGELIDDSLTVDNGFGVLQEFGEFDNFIGTRGFAAVKFDIPGGSPHFGYLDIAVDQTGNRLTLFGGAYESETGVGILAGAVPEPSGLGLLALGATGLAAWRRKS